MNLQDETTTTFSSNDWKIIQEYFRIYDSPEKRSKAIADLIGHKGCIYCGELNVRTTRNGRAVWCARCRKRTWLTAGTFFENMRRLDVAHGILTLLERGVNLCAHQASVLLDCAYDTSWNFFLKLEIVIAEKMPGCVQLIESLSAIYKGLFIRRSNQTPANAHPREEQKAFEDQFNTEDVNSSQSASGFESNNESKNNESPCYQSPILQLITDNSVDFDMLHEKSGMPIPLLTLELLELELAKLIVRLPGERYARSRELETIGTNQHIISIQILEECPGLKADEAFLEHALQYIRQVSQGISRKYLQLSLCLHWFQFDKVSWNQGELTHACKVHRAITKKEIKSCVTPLIVKTFRVDKARLAS